MTESDTSTTVRPCHTCLSGWSWWGPWWLSIRWCVVACTYNDAAAVMVLRGCVTFVSVEKTACSLLVTPCAHCRLHAHRCWKVTYAPKGNICRPIKNVAKKTRVICVAVCVTRCTFHRNKCPTTQWDGEYNPKLVRHTINTVLRSVLCCRWGVESNKAGFTSEQA
jgi:hypothetical protein